MSKIHFQTRKVASARLGTQTLDYYKTMVEGRRGLGVLSVTLENGNRYLVGRLFPDDTVKLSIEEQNRILLILTRKHKLGSLQQSQTAELLNLYNASITALGQTQQARAASTLRQHRVDVDDFYASLVAERA